MARSEWPNAIKIPSAPRIRGKCSNQPDDGDLVGSRLESVKIGFRGGTWIDPCGIIQRVNPLQAKISNPMTVVNCMIRSALSLDSCMPMMLARQKYSVMPIAISIVRKLIVLGWVVASKRMG